MKKYIIFIIILFTFSCQAQNIEGKYIEKMDIPYGVYVDNEPIKYYTFKKNVFKYKKKSMGYTSIKGKGEYKIVRDSLFLNFNRTKLQKRSYYKYSTYDDCKDSITVKVKMLDYNGNSFPSSELENFLVSADKKFATKKDDYFYCKFKKDENEFVVIDVVGANEKYYPCEIVLRPRLSYVISVYMFKGKSHNMLKFLPIELKNCTWKYKIDSITKNKIYLKYQNGKQFYLEKE